MSKLFTDTPELKKYGMVNVSYSIQDINPELEVQEEKTIIPYIGRDQFDRLADGLANNNLTPDELLLLDKVRLPLAQFAIAHTSFTRYIQESSSGSHVTKTEHKVPAGMQSMARRRNETLIRAYNAIDILLGFLDRNKGTYPLWANSDAYSNYKGLLIYTPIQLAEHLPNSNSQALFKQYVPILREREIVIRGRIGQPYFDELKDQVLNDTLTPENLIVVEQYIRPALAFLAHEQATFKLVHVHPFGLYFYNELNLDQNASVMKAMPKFLDAVMENYHNQAETKLFDLLRFLSTNINSYPTYRDSDAYTPPEDDTPDNSNCGCDVESQSNSAKIGCF